MKRRDRLAVLSSIAIFALVTALLYGVPASGQTPPEADFARGYSYGASAIGGQDPQLDPLPEAEAVAPPPEPQGELKRVSKQDIGASTILGDLLKIESDACLDTGVSARLQHKMNAAEILARGEEPAGDDNDVNEGPNDEDPERGEVRYPAGFPDTARCVAPVGSGVPIEGPSSTVTPTEQPSPDPTASPTEAPLCEEVVTDPEDPEFSPTCLATFPLWNSHGYAMATDVLGEDVQAEAVARCTADGELEVATGADYGLLGTLASSTDEPNQHLSIPVLAGEVSAVIYWETNWDPITNSTTDGSDTVWVNGLHIVTSTGRDIILSHAEATADCGGDDGGPSPGPDPIPAACTPAPGTEPSGQVIIGTQGPDAIVGTPRDDIICTLAGDDIASGLDGQDLIILGSGDDEGSGGGAKDTIHGDAGSDSLNGGLQHDLLIGGTGADQMKGNRGNDTLRGGRGPDTLQGGNGDDLLRGGRGHDSLKGYNGDDILNGDQGVDQCKPGRGRDFVRNCERR